MTQIKLIFAIFGDLLNIETLNNTIKIAPSEFWNKGDLIPNRKIEMFRNETCWNYSIGFIPTLSFEEISINFMDIIRPELDLLSKYICENNLESRLDIVIEIVNEEKPSLSINKNLMDMMLKLNGEIELDLYVLED